MSSPRDSSSSSEKPPEHKEESHSRSRDKKKSKRSKSSSSPVRRSRKIIINIPDLNGYLVPFNSFMSKQTGRIDRGKLESHYSNYKKDWKKNQDQIFLQEHKNDCWFQEKYNPEWKAKIEKERNQLIKVISQKFFKDYEDGVFQRIDYNTNKQEVAVITDNDVVEENEIDLSLKSSVKLYESPYFGLNPDEFTYFIKNIPKDISRFDILEQVNKLPGFFSLSLSDPVKRYQFQRYAWVAFKDQESYDKASILLGGIYIKEQPLVITKSVSKQRRVKLIKPYQTVRIEVDCSTSSDLIRTLDKEEGVEGNPFVDNPPTSKQFDINLLYLRRVHAYDYFAALSFGPYHYADERALVNKNGLFYLRIPVEGTEEYGLSSTIKRTQADAAERAKNPREKPDCQELIKLELLKLSGAETQQKSIWKCNNCSKKFETQEFLRNHVLNKHISMREDAIYSMIRTVSSEDKYKITDYPPQPMREDKEDDRRNYGGRGRPRGGYRKPHTPYQDLDNPTNIVQADSKGRTLVNFLDI